jgi:hypothetical protein
VNEEGTVKRITPQSGLDMNMMLTDTMWGSQQISTQISNKVRNRSRDPEASKSAAWDLLSFYTRDFRLANLNAALGEVGYCQHYIDLAGDCLREGYMESFAASLGRGARTQPKQVRVSAQKAKHANHGELDGRNRQKEEKPCVRG